jgi:hypothetical protein
MARRQLQRTTRVIENGPSCNDEVALLVQELGGKEDNADQGLLSDVPMNYLNLSAFSPKSKESPFIESMSPGVRPHQIPSLYRGSPALHVHWRAAGVVRRASVGPSVYKTVGVVPGAE